MWRDERDRKLQPTYSHHLVLLCNSQITWFQNLVQQKLAFRRMDNVFWFNSNWCTARQHIWDLCSALPVWALTKPGVGLCKIRRMALLKNTVSLCLLFFIFDSVGWAFILCICQTFKALFLWSQELEAFITMKAEIFIFFLLATKAVRTPPGLFGFQQIFMQWNAEMKFCSSQYWSVQRDFALISSLPCPHLFNPQENQSFH